ncbi:MAG: cobalamin biosynthesis protein CbiX [Puniceicoccaceae bacterium]|nr:MAG: cobalamin biosynthesis protein CbiX [Puniceicoccaceae bacterium]
MASFNFNLPPVSTPIVFLIDNGSLRPEATFGLRRLAEKLAERSSLPVEAVSLLHSHKISPDDLDGRGATIVRRRLRECIDAGQRQFVFLPLFLGPSLAIADYLPQLIEEGRAQAPDLRVEVAEVLAGPDVDVPDARLAQILADQVLECHPGPATKVALVDHGTPARPVNRVRNAVARQLAEILGKSVAGVEACSMERREGADYAFNDPLLESIGEVPGFGGGHLILAMFFLLPGRHAGMGGDVAEICDALVDAKAFEQIQTTPLLGEHPALLDILMDRLIQASSAFF